MSFMRPMGLFQTIRLTPLVVVLGSISFNLNAAETVWNFSNPANRFAAASGLGTLNYYDPQGSSWGTTATAFGTASSFGLPAMPGGDANVMRFPACTSVQGYRVVHASSANGPYGEINGRVSNYTLVMDVLFPSGSDGRWRALYQTDTNNTTDAEFYVQNAPSGGIGINGLYHGSIRSNTWHRIAIVVQAAPGEGKCQRFIDGRFVGGIGSTGSGLDVRWALDRAFLLFTENDGETASGYVSSIYFADRALRMEQIQALGGPHAAGANVPGSPAPPIDQRMPRRVSVVGHRGGFFCCAPDNTMAAVRYAISNQVPIIEIDTRLSADGVCVLVHDATVDRTTDGTGTVVSRTVAQLKQLDAGSWFSPDFAGERIPTVAEVMAEAKGKMILYFDLKVPGQIDAITNALAQTGFNPDDCWFWVYNSTSDAASIRAKLPAAKIIWEPPGTWASDPNFFTTMRSIGVYGFDLGVYYGTISSAFVRAAKEEGFVVGIYTILDPDTMVRNAAAGVDFMETDFPQIMNILQPAQTASAAPINPANGAPNISVNPMLTWLTGSNATAHRIYFGTSSAPPFLRQQTYDIVSLTNLSTSTTYYWRIDEVIPGGAVVTGAVWSFTTTANPTPSARFYEWTFDSRNLSATLGNGIMEYADGATVGLTIFGSTDETTVPHVGGQPATYMRVPALTGLNNGYQLTFSDSGPNGNGVYINEFTFIADLLIPNNLNWTALFNSSPENGNDADWYVDPAGRVGIGDLGYAPAGSIGFNGWYRLVFCADLGAGLVRFYRDGIQIFQRTGASLRDGRFSLYSNNDPGPDLLLFNEGDSSGVYTHELYAASIAFVDRALSAAEIAALGPPNADGIFVKRLRVRYAGDMVRLSWIGASNTRLQKSPSLQNPNWEDVPNTLGATAYSEPAPTTPAFYRLLTQ